MPGLHMLSERGGGVALSLRPPKYLYLHILCTLNVCLAFFNVSTER